MDKIKISLMVTGDTLAQMQLLGERLLPGVELSRGDVVGYLVAEKVKVLGLGAAVRPEAEVEDTLDLVG